MTEREAYIALNMMTDIGPVSVRALAGALGSTAAIFKAPRSDLLKTPGVGPALVATILAQRDKIRPDREIQAAAKLGVQIITPLDESYPRPLLQIHDPPLALYVRGTLNAADKRAIGVVGSRHTTIYGRETAERLAYQLAKCGFTVVSGLARGIDTAAHRGALKGGGRTLAVLGGAIDNIYPPENKPLADDIAKQGAVISEFPLGRQPDKTTFPMRNRIVSGLSMGVLVVEAGLTSGALITAAQALEQGRSVFAVPGRIDSPHSKGAHQLIKNGARLVECVEDLLQEFEFLFRPENKPVADAPAGPPLPPEERRLMEALAEGEEDLDALIRQTGLPAARMSVLLLGLEMKRMVRVLPGRRIEIIRR